MMRRLWWIAVSYVTRPFVLALIVAGTVFLALSFVPDVLGWTRWWAYPGRPEARHMVDSKASLEAARRSGRQAEVDGIDVDKLWNDVTPLTQSKFGPYRGYVDEQFYRVLKEFPNLRIVHARFWNAPTGIEQIASLKKVEYLDLDGGGLYDFRPLARLRNLRRLDLGISDSLQIIGGRPVIAQLIGFDHLASLPQLDTLVLSRRSVLSDAVLAEFGKLPHLSVLAMNPIDNPKTVPKATRAGFGALARAPKLRMVYVDDPELSALAKASLSNAWIFPNNALVVLSMLVKNAFMVLIPCFFFSMAIGAQLSNQFFGASSRIVPRYVVTHVVVGVLLVLAVVGLGVSRLMAIGLEIPAAIAIAAALVASILLMGAPSARTWAMGKTKLKGVEHLTYLCPILVFNSLNTSMWGGTNAPLNSSMAVMAYGLIACAAGIGAVVILAGLAESSGNSALVRRDRASMAWLSGSAGGSSGLLLALRRRERQLDALASQPLSNSGWQRVQRWRLGNPPYRAGLMMFALLALLVPVALMSIFLDDEQFGEYYLVFFSGWFLVAMTAQVAMMWRARLLVLPLEMLRPVSRPVAQRELAVAFACDLLPLAAMNAAVAAAGVNLKQNLTLSLAPTAGSFLLFLALGSVWSVAGAALVVIERTWISVAVLTTMVFGFFVLAWAQDRSGINSSWFSWDSIADFQRQLWLPLLVGVILCCVMWRRWRKLEIGMRA